MMMYSVIKRGTFYSTEVRGRKIDERQDKSTEYNVSWIQVGVRKVRRMLVRNRKLDRR